MGMPRRDGGSGTVSVNIRPLIKTCVEEQGLGELTLKDGTRIVALAHTFWPNHDRSLMTAVRALLADVKPDVVFFLGGALNEEAFKQVVDEQDRSRRLVAQHEAPELTKIRAEKESQEERFLALARGGGEFLADIQAAAGCHMYYIPATPAGGGSMPNELGILDFVLGQKAKIDDWAERHPEQGKAGPDISSDFATFIGVDANPNITVLPFGSAIRVNGKLRFMIGDFKRRHPGSSSQVDIEQLGESVVRSFDGKVASTFWTTPVHSLPEAVRRHWQAHEIGNLYDLSQLGFLRNYDRRGKSIWVGDVAGGGTVFGRNVVVQRGSDGKRCLLLDGKGYTEDAVYTGGKVFGLTLPEKEEAKPAPAKKSARKPRGGKKKGK